MSCLFRSLSYFVPSDSAELIRQKVCTFLALNRYMAHSDTSTYIKWETGMSLRDYVRKMRSEQTWGGAIEIQAFCELYGISVHCIDQRTNQPFVYNPTSKPYHKHITLLWQNQCHYEPRQS
jgi:hypothetical protein